MHVIADFCLVPVGTEATVAPYVAACQRVLAACRGVESTLHATGTTLEGDFDDVMAAVRRCHEEVHRMGVVRIHTTLSVSTRTDLQRPAAERIERVQALLDV